MAKGKRGAPSGPRRKKRVETWALYVYKVLK